jgi:hypothetical protein
MVKRKSTPRRNYRRIKRAIGNKRRYRSLKRVFRRYVRRRRKAAIPRYNTWSRRKLRSNNRMLTVTDFIKREFTFNWGSFPIGTIMGNNNSRSKTTLFMDKFLLNVPKLHTNEVGTNNPLASIYAKYIQLKILATNDTKEKVYLRIVIAWDKYFGHPTKPTLDRLIKIQYDTTVLPALADFFTQPYNKPYPFEDADFNTVQWKPLNPFRYTTVWNKVYPLSPNFHTEDSKNIEGFGNYMASGTYNIPINRILYYDGDNSSDKTSEYPQNAKLCLFSFLGTKDPDTDFQAADTYKEFTVPVQQLKDPKDKTKGYKTVNQFRRDMIRTDQRLSVKVNTHLHYVLPKQTSQLMLDDKVHVLPSESAVSENPPSDNQTSPPT